ncbi:MAG: HU family DNA-binding protein, partial [Bacteroidales bacterium]|nr:HU family DNA-binding protein [Bacteroidales bacterium]
MSSKLNMQDIVDFLVAKNDISKEEAEKFIVELFSLIEKGLTDDELSKVKDFGTFKLTHIKERESIDVNTKERIVIPAHRRVSFVPAQLLKELVNKPFSHFETTPLNDGVFIDGIPHDETSKRERLEETDDGDDNNSKESEPTKEEIIVKSNLIVTAVEDAKKEKDEFLVPITSSALDTESNKEEDANEEGPIGEEKKEVDKDKVVVGLSETPSVDKSRPKRKPRRYLLRSATIVLFIIFAIGFAYNYYFSENSLEQEVKISKAAKSVDKSTVSSTEDPLGEPDIVIDSVDTVELRVRETAKMSPGRTLRLIALDRFGDREFWVYIYMTNKDKITNPNIVSIGLVLELPHHD